MPILILKPDLKIKWEDRLINVKEHTDPTLMAH
jgi:hypothetical protein